MPDVYLIIVLLLFTLAVLDLIVGVSNDAVNFLNSAIGSKAASRKVIMIVASLGIFAGATFSSGMMEVARSGIFNPQFFVFDEVMILFLAVMLTDIILLDLFNTFGMPTSTTVSIVFELLGAAVMISILKLAASGEPISQVGTFINSAKAVTIISGIFLSILFAFTTGMFVQYFSRLLFTFDYKKKLNLVGAIWAGLALAALTYFLLFKGLKGASFVTDGFIDWIKNHTLYLLTTSFFLWTAFMFVLIKLKVNIFRIVVLFGTFSLAMAFAGNDLVNFIGVPIAGLESFLAWDQAGTAAKSFNMAFLKEPVRTNSLLLIAAGGVMIITLWFSKKARSVTETEVNLGRQDEGFERFSPNIFARWIVRQSNRLSHATEHLMPKSWRIVSEKSFTPQKADDAKAAFDLIRASVNLTVASMLVAFATSLKLPLSTTYVSFMVAMGTSLADRAWGRDSAVFRVAGVINVVGGWLATALIAFSVSAIFALFMFSFRLPAISLLVMLALLFIYRTFRYHKQKEKKKSARLAFENEDRRFKTEEVMASTSDRVASLLRSVRRVYTNALNGLISENRDMLKQAKKEVQVLLSKNEDFRYELFKSIQRIDEQDAAGSKRYLSVYNLEQDIVQSTQFVMEACLTHVENVHTPLTTGQIAALEHIKVQMGSYLERVCAIVLDTSPGPTSVAPEQKNAILESLDIMQEQQTQGIQAKRLGGRNSLLMFSLLLESKDITKVVGNIASMYE